MTEVHETEYGELTCGKCGFFLQCGESGDMPRFCPECGATLDWSLFSDPEAVI